MEFDETHFEVSTFGKDRFLAETRFMRNPMWRSIIPLRSASAYADSSLSFRGKVLYSPDIPATRKIIEIANKIMEFPAYMKKLVDLLNKQKGFLRQFAQDTESIQMIKVRNQDNVSSLSYLGHKANSK